ACSVTGCATSQCAQALHAGKLCPDEGLSVEITDNLTPDVNGCRCQRSQVSDFVNLCASDGHKQQYEGNQNCSLHGLLTGEIVGTCLKQMPGEEGSCSAGNGTYRTIIRTTAHIIALKKA